MAEVVLQDVTKKYGDVTAVSNFSIEIVDGEFFTLLGPSGCGKTTLLRCVAGFIHVTAGKIYIGNRLVSSGDQKNFVPPEKRNLGMVFQSYAVWPHMSVFGNVSYPLKIQRHSDRDIKSRVRDVLRLLKLEEYEKRYPNELSGGQQQRVALGRALIMDPEVLLLDEPLSNLDAKLREEMRFELKELQKRIGVTIIYVTHDQSEAMVMSKRIAVMNEGCINQVGTPHEIYNNPESEFVASFIGKSNFISGEVVEVTNSVCRVRIGNSIIDIESTEKPDGKNVTVMVRHHNVELSEKKLSGSIPARVKIATYLGDRYIYEIEAEGTTLKAQTDAFRPRKEGEDIHIRLHNPVIF
jgi:iron(III) transport system ATP-binding protein